MGSLKFHRSVGTLIQNGVARQRFSAKVHINHDSLVLVTEGDVEQKVVLPILCGPIFLEIPSSKIFSKEYLVPTPFRQKCGSLIRLFSGLHRLDARFPGTSC